MRVRSKLSILAVAAAGLGAVAGPAAAPAAVQRASALTQFEGKVVSVNRADKQFRVRDAERGTARIRVTRNTRFERIDGIAGLHKGLRVEVTTKRAGGHWVATQVERRRPGSGGNHDD
jgi:hypothetical protein